MGRLLALDVRMGMAGSGIPLATLAGVSLASLVSDYGSAVSAGHDVSGLSFADNVALLFAGSQPYEYRAGVLFMPPIGWLLMLMLVLYVTLSYPYRDLHGFGQQVLMRGGSRRSWWVSKCVWVAGMTGLAVVVLLVVAAIWTLIQGQSFDMDLHGALLYVARGPVERLRMQETSAWPFVLGALVTLLAIDWLQLALSLVLRPSIAYLGILLYLIFSAFAQHPLLVGNALMLVRWGGLIESGVDPACAGAVALGIALAAILCGGALFSRMDISDHKEYSA